METDEGVYFKSVSVQANCESEGGGVCIVIEFDDGDRLLIERKGQPWFGGVCHAVLLLARMLEREATRRAN